jgi:hypothetical protein
VVLKLKKQEHFAPLRQGSYRMMYLTANWSMNEIDSRDGMT